MNITLPSIDPMWIDPIVNFLAVLLGAVLTWVVTYHFEKLRTRDANISAAYRLFFKIQMLTERATKLERHVQACLSRLADGAPPEDSWTHLGRIIGFSKKPEDITADELAIIAIHGETDFVTKIQEMEDGHNILFEVFEEIQRLREIVRPHVSIVARTGDIATVEVDQSRLRQLTPEITALETASVSLIEMLPEIASEARSIATELGHKLKKHYGFKHSLEYPEATNPPSTPDTSEPV